MAVSTTITSLITLIILLAHNKHGALDGAFTSFPDNRKTCSSVTLSCSPHPVKLNPCNLLPEDKLALWKTFHFLENCVEDYHQCVNTFLIHPSNNSCFTEVYKHPVTACFNYHEKLSSFKVDGGLLKNCGTPPQGNATDLRKELAHFLSI